MNWTQIVHKFSDATWMNTDWTQRPWTQTGVCWFPPRLERWGEAQVVGLGGRLVARTLLYSARFAWCGRGAGVQVPGFPGPVSCNILLSYCYVLILLYHYIINFLCCMVILFQTRDQIVLLIYWTRMEHKLNTNCALILWLNPTFNTNWNQIEHWLGEDWTQILWFSHDGTPIKHRLTTNYSIQPKLNVIVCRF